MKINYTLKLVVEVDDSEIGADSPKEYLEKRIEEDVIWLVEDSVLLSHKMGKIEKTINETDEDDDDDDLTEIDEDEMETF